MSTRSLQSLFDDYSAHHQNETNIIVHWICVPVIFFSVIGLLVSIPPKHLQGFGAPVASLVILAVLALFYLPKSIVMTIAMGVWSIGCLSLAVYIDRNSQWPLWAISLVLFAAAWIGQFWGHKVEGSKPSFLKDLTFLLIGPAWLMAKVMKRVGVTY